jgi:hypothetical protein
MEQDDVIEVYQEQTGGDLQRWTGISTTKQLKIFLHFNRLWRISYMMNYASWSRVSLVYLLCIQIDK